jgi:hypothetical protein
MKNVYLASLIAGAILPFCFALEHLRAHGASPVAFIQEATTTSAARACFVDLCLAGLVFLGFAIYDSARSGVAKKHVWIAAMLTPVGLVSTVAYYLWRRECSLEKQRSA